MPTGDGPATGAERVRDHHERQRKRGLKLIRVWVPGDGESAEQVRRLAADLRKKAGMPLLHDHEIPASPKPSRSPPVPPKKAAKPKKQSKSEEKPKKRRSPGKERRYQRRKAERAARAKK